MRNLLLAGVALIASAAGAHASLITQASLYSPLLPATGTSSVIGLQAVTAPSQNTIQGNGYTLSFGTDANQGVVRGAASGLQAIPVAGVTAAGAATYLTGDFGSARTTDAARAGNYLSTGLGTITLTFAAPQVSLALLWGSIDTSNFIRFGNAAGDTLTGAQVQALAAGFSSNGFQGPTGSAYVSVLSDTAFTTVTFGSGVVSFELAGVAASSAPFTAVPEPASFALFGMGLLGLGMVRRRRG